MSDTNNTRRSTRIRKQVNEQASDSEPKFSLNERQIKTRTNLKQRHTNSIHEASNSKSAPLRKSSRTTKFSRSMREQDADALDYFFTINQGEQHLKKKRLKSQESESESNLDSCSQSSVSTSNSGANISIRKPNKQMNDNHKKNSSIASSRLKNISKTKSPAVSHSTRRRKAKTEASEQYKEDSESTEKSYSSHDDESEAEEKLKIQRIIASRSETRKTWRSIVHNMNTSEVHNGSRWFQDDEIDPSQDDVYEERYLIKWADVGYLHCSWELEEDLLTQVDKARSYLSTFFRKAQNGLLFNLDERGDGEYFNPDYLVIDRVLAIEYPEYDCVYTKTSKIKSSEKPNSSTSLEKKGLNKSNNNILGNENVALYGILFDKAHPKYEERTGRQFLVKWSNIGYSECTYEFERDLILLDIDYQKHVNLFSKRRIKPTKTEMQSANTSGDKQSRRLYKFFGEKVNLTVEERELKAKEYQEKLMSIVFPNGGTLRDYQAEGVSWILSNHANSRSSILADEMGLGKTLQTVVYINVLVTTLHLRGPYLIIAPLSTVHHWQREFSNWTDLNTIIYHGSAADREYIREYDFAFECDRPEQLWFRQKYLSNVHDPKSPKWSRTWMVQVVITTPEIMTAEDFSELSAISWEVMVVDEAHKLKNFNSKLATNLRSNHFDFKRSLLLTGTPIQNNIGELWTLMNFIDPEKFTSSTSFLDRFGDMKSKERIDELHESIRPYILRRLKEDVEKSVPPKEETIIEVELTIVQKQYYRALYEKNVQFLHKNKKRNVDRPSLNNLAMQLRKCCNHPFLLRGVEEELRSKEGKKINEADFLSKTSGKLVLLNKLLPRLQSDGHRVLIFSQFKIMLDILEDYLRLHNTKYERIDGCITGQKRQMAIDRFQAKNQNGKELPLVMLLSTRAGGVGINLTAADTCIIYDSDWNPQNDLQAQARCHRIGQTKDVKVYRLLSRKSYEMQMFHMSSLKMGLDQAVLQGIENSGTSSGMNMTKEEIEKLLRHGAYDIFKEDKDGSAEKKFADFLDADIDTIMARQSKTITHENTGSNSNACGGTFSKAVFKAGVTKNGNVNAEDVDIDDPEFWKKVVGEAKDDSEAKNAVGKKRKRKVTNYSENVSVDLDLEAASVSSYDYFSELDDDEKFSNAQERYRWGGTSESNWKREDVDYLQRQLVMFGYNNKRILLANMKKRYPKNDRYSTDEIIRMCWTLVFVSILETVDSEIIEGNKRAERAAKRKSEGLSLENKPEEGAKSGKPQFDEAYAEKVFRKMIEMHSTWLFKVFSDANICSKPARSLNLVNSILDEKDHNFALHVAFNENVWPALKSRGWKTEEIRLEEDSNAPRKKFIFKARTYDCLEDVLKVATNLHPELNHVIASVQGSSQTNTKESENIDSKKAPDDSNETKCLSVQNVSYCAMNTHLRKFGSLQLIFDRSRRIPELILPKKILTTLFYVHTINNLLTLADEHIHPNTNNSATKNFELQKLIQVDNGPLPHSQWRSWHDAVLVRAIAKHGWIDQQTNYKAIIEDKSIEWGRPFDAKETPLISESKTVEESEDSLLIEAIATRAANFLNEFGFIIDELKGFNKGKIVSSYNLCKQQGDQYTDSSRVLWIVDKKNSIESKNITQDQLGKAVFPPRQDLLKRAKYIIGNFSSKQMLKNVDEKEKEGEKKEFSGCAQLNQRKRSNVFLVEMLHALVKTSARKMDGICKRILEHSVKEARELYLTCSKKNPSTYINKTELDNLHNILNNLTNLRMSGDLRLRQHKNMLRVILGLGPLKGNNCNMNVQSITNAQSTLEFSASTRVDLKDVTSNNGTLEQIKLPESATGDIAISRALQQYLKQGRSEREGDLNLSSFETLLLSVVCSQGLPIWSEKWEELVTNIKHMHSNKEIMLEKGKEFKITWTGMGQVIERAAMEWKRIAFEELSKLNEQCRSASNADDYKLLYNKLLVLKQDVKTKDDAYKQALMFSKDPLFLAKKVIMLLESLRLRMGAVEFYRGGNQKKHRLSNCSDGGIGPRVLSWLSKEMINWAKCLEIINHSTKLPLSFPANEIYNQCNAHTVAILDKISSRAIFAQVAQQSRLRSFCISNGVSGLVENMPRANRVINNANDVWRWRPHWWGKTDSESFKNDVELLCGILNFGYSGFDIMIQHYPEFQNHATQIQTKAIPTSDVNGNRTIFSRHTVQPRINQLTRELSAMEDAANAMRSIAERTNITSIGSNRNNSSNLSNTVQTDLNTFFTSPRMPIKHMDRNDSPVSIHSDVNSNKTQPTRICSEDHTNKRRSKGEVGKNVIDLCGSHDML